MCFYSNNLIIPLWLVEYDMATIIDMSVSSLTIGRESWVQVVGVGNTHN